MIKVWFGLHPDFNRDEVIDDNVELINEYREKDFEKVLAGKMDILRYFPNRLSRKVKSNKITKLKHTNRKFIYTIFKKKPVIEFITFLKGMGHFGPSS